MRCAEVRSLLKSKLYSLAMLDLGLIWGIGAEFLYGAYVWTLALRVWGWFPHGLGAPVLSLCQVCVHVLMGGITKLKWLEIVKETNCKSDLQRSFESCLKRIANAHWMRTAKANARQAQDCEWAFLCHCGDMVNWGILPRYGWVRRRHAPNSGSILGLSLGRRCCALVVIVDLLGVALLRRRPDACSMNWRSNFFRAWMKASRVIKTGVVSSSYKTKALSLELYHACSDVALLIVLK